MSLNIVSAFLAQGSINLFLEITFKSSFLSLLYFHMEVISSNFYSHYFQVIQGMRTVLPFQNVVYFCTDCTSAEKTHVFQLENLKLVTTKWVQIFNAQKMDFICLKHVF